VRVANRHSRKQNVEMTERIILSIVSIIMLALTLKKGNKLTITLTSGLTIGILVTWTSDPSMITVGLIAYTLTAFLISILNLRTKELSKINQATIVMTGIWALGANLFLLMQWPYAREIRLSMIIPIIFYVFSLLNGMTKRKELGYLTIMNAEFVLRLFR
jgi:hypothetical protein